MKKVTKSDLIFVIVIAVSLFFIGVMFTYCNKYTEKKYLLSELDNDVYAIYYNTYSNVPADNYEVVTLCCDGIVHTFNGDVSIKYTDNEPYVFIKDYNYVNGDKINLAVPKGTVVYEKSVGIVR